jgi:hypothetical protein
MISAKTKTRSSNIRSEDKSYYHEVLDLVDLVVLQA